MKSIQDSSGPGYSDYPSKSTSDAVRRSGEVASGSLLDKPEQGFDGVRSGIIPKVSVIITTCNAARYIADSIRSVLRQTFPDFELLIVDDGSRDNTRDIVGYFKDNRIKYIYQENRGVSSARNRGIKESTGQYIAFLDADDIWLSEKLEKQLQALEAYPQAKVVYSDMLLFNPESPANMEPFLPRAKRPFARGRVLEPLAYSFFGFPSSILIKREALDKVGLFDETLSNCQDYDLVLRLASHFEFEVVPQPLLLYRIHPGQLSHNQETVWPCRITCFRRALRIPDNTLRMRRRLLSRLSECYFEYGLYCLKQKRFFRAGRQWFTSIRMDGFMFSKLFASLVQRSVISKSIKISGRREPATVIKGETKVNPV